MAAGKSSRVNRKYKTKCRIRNWREYERGLRSRGDVTIWLSEEAIATWTPAKNGLRGGQRRYSNLAILTALTLRVVFHLPLRQTEGFLDSLLSLMGLDLKAPDHTTLSRRNQIVEVPPLTRAHDGPIHLIVRFHGAQDPGLRRNGIRTSTRHPRNAGTGESCTSEWMTRGSLWRPNSRRAAGTTPPPCRICSTRSRLPSRRFTADGAYDNRAIYDRVGAAGTEDVVIVIPPRRYAVSAGPTDGPWAQREAALQRVRKIGRREWQKELGYRQQARVENGFFRYKSVLGGSLKARNSNAQRKETTIGCHILNRMAEARQAEVLRRGVMNEGLGKRPDSRQG